MLNPQDLDAIRQRAEKATAGEWRWWDDYDFREHLGNQDWSTENFQMGRIKLTSGGQQGQSVIYDWAEYADDSGFIIKREDAEFIAHARTDIPALLAHVEELEARLANSPKDEQSVRCGNTD